MITITIDKESLRSIRNLQQRDVEYNGQIVTNSHGDVDHITSQQGQVMQKCFTGCILNYHTHPPDYTNLYPDHPSTTDMKYIYSATCANKELGSHLIFTPKFIYVIRYDCPSWISRSVNLIALRYRVDSLFEKLANSYDRSTESFRKEWIGGLHKIGFVIYTFTYSDKIVFETPQGESSYSYIFIMLLLILIYFFSL